MPQKKDPQPTNDSTGEKKIPVEKVEHTSSKTPKSDRHQRAESAKEFSDLYKRSAAEQEQARHFQRRTPHGQRNKIIAWSVASAVVIILAVAAGFYFFVNQEDTFTNESIEIRIDSGDSVISGEETTMLVTITNNETVAITNTELTLRLPSEFTFVSSVPQPANEAKNAWDIGTINPGKEKLVSITGTFTGETRTQLSIDARLNYVPANFSSVFETREALTVTIDGSVLEVKLNAPTKSIANRSDEFQLTVSNQSASTVDNVIVSIALPSEMNARDFDPAPVATDDLRWPIDELAANEQVIITWQGTMDAEQGASGEIIATAGYTDKSGEYIPQSETNAIVFVVNPQLIISLAQDDSTTGVPVTFGDMIQYEISLKNGSDAVINDLQVELDLNAAVLDWSDVVNPLDATVVGNTITWTAEDVSALASLQPGESASVTLSIPVLDTYDADSQSDGNLVISAVAQATSESVADLEGQPLIVTSDTLETKVTSDVELRAEARYYDDEYIAVGSGPLPPEVGEETTYQLYWYLQNTTNQVTDVSVSATLPDGVTWLDDSEVTAGVLTYDKTEKTISWTINKLPQHVGTFIPEVRAQFMVGITPSSSDVGDLVTLLSQAVLTTTDSFTERVIRKTQPLLTTALPQDPLAIGKGEVVPATSTTNTNSNTNTNTNSAANTNGS